MGRCRTSSGVWLALLPFVLPPIAIACASRSDEPTDPATKDADLPADGGSSGDGRDTATPSPGDAEADADSTPIADADPSDGSTGSTNLAILPDFWDSKWLGWNDGYNAFPETWQGQGNCLRIAPNPTFIEYQRDHGWTGENEINGMLCDSDAVTCPRDHRTRRVPVKPGDHVVYGAWIWVTPSTIGDGHGGGLQLFVDVYGDAGRIKELQGEFGGDDVGRLNVPFGSTGWTHLEMHFDVKNTYRADGALGAPGGTDIVPTGIIPILQLNNWDPVNGYSEKATAYVRDTALHVTSP